MLHVYYDFRHLDNIYIISGCYYVGYCDFIIGRSPSHEGKGGQSQGRGSKSHIHSQNILNLHDVGLLITAGR